MADSDSDWFSPFDGFLSVNSRPECEKAAEELSAAKRAELTEEERRHGYVSQTITAKQVRHAIARECSRLVQRDGLDTFTAPLITHLFERIYRGQIKFCKACRWPFFPHRKSRTLCGSADCKKRRRIEKEGFRELDRRFSRKGAERKREDRAIAKVVPRADAILNQEIDALVARADPAKKFRWRLGKLHISVCRRSLKERQKLLRFLRTHASADFLLEVRAALRRKHPKAQG